MSTIRRAALTAGLCAVAGAGVGIATSAAAPSHAKARDTAGNSPTSTTRTTGHGGGGPASDPADGFGMMAGGMPVHGELTVLNEAGDAYITQTVDDGTVDSVSGDSVVIKEGTKSAGYKTVTLKIPDGATVLDGFDKATLANVKAGDKIHVMQSSEKTFVWVGAHGFDGMGCPTHDGALRHASRRAPMDFVSLLVIGVDRVGDPPRASPQASRGRSTTHRLAPRRDARAPRRRVPPP